MPQLQDKQHKKEAFLTLAISTFGERIQRISPPEPEKDILILVVWQNHANEAIPEALNREDITVIRTETLGLSKSRNLAIQKATTRYLWIGDDDVEIYTKSLLSLVRDMQKEPGITFITGMIEVSKGVLFKPYKNVRKNWRVHTTAKLSSIEIVVDVEKVISHNVSFDENFGLGAKWTMGEEFIFASDIIKRGGRGLFVPTILARHPEESTGKNYGDPKVWMASSAAIKRVYGPFWSFFIRLAMLFKKRKYVRGYKNKLRFMRVKP